MRFYTLVTVLILTACNPSNVNFSREYIAQHENAFVVQIPEVHELVNIMIAISDVGQKDTNMINHSGPYYKKVLEHFLPFKNHLAIQIINSQIKYGFNTLPKGTDRQVLESYKHYNGWRMNACGYVLNSEDEIVDDGIIKKMGFKYPDDPINENKELIQNFAEISGFRNFFEKNKGYYLELIESYENLNPINKMKSWLKKQFNKEYGSYRIIFSPLVGGSHATNKFSDNGLEQTVMFVSAAKYENSATMSINELRSSRVVFTEIDHHYVNPVSLQYRKSIEQAFKERSYWVDESQISAGAYITAMSVFNEYMTWAVFSLYALDNFPEKDVEQYISIMEQRMIKRRGFIRFKEFNRKLMSVYRNRPKGKTIVDLYPNMVTWSITQSY